MGLLDQLGSMLGGESSKLNQAKSILGWVEQQGGFHGLLEKFQHGGVGEIFQSWIGSGTNLPISGEQLQGLFNNDSLKQLSSSLGVNVNDATGILAKFLPTVVDKLSPNGELPEHNDLVSTGLSLLKNKLFG